MGDEERITVRKLKQDLFIDEGSLMCLVPAGAGPSFVQYRRSHDCHGARHLMKLK
jgi:hypothetical protein